MCQNLFVPCLTGGAIILIDCLCFDSCSRRLEHLDSIIPSIALQETREQKQFHWMNLGNERTLSESNLMRMRGPGRSNYPHLSPCLQGCEVPTIQEPSRPPHSHIIMHQRLFPKFALPDRQRTRKRLKQMQKMTTDLAAANVLLCDLLRNGFFSFVFLLITLIHFAFIAVVLIRLRWVFVVACRHYIYSITHCILYHKAHSILLPRPGCVHRPSYISHPCFSLTNYGSSDAQLFFFFSCISLE